MKKVIISVMLSLCLTLTFCLFPFCKPAKGSNPPRETINPIATFPLTMTPSELLEKAKELGLKINVPYDNPDYSLEHWGIENPVYDGRWYNGSGSGSFSYRYDEINFFFTENGTMEGFSTKSDLFATPEGIRVGDSMLKMLRTYGISSITKGLAIKTKDGYYIFRSDIKRANKIFFWSFSETPFEHEN